MPRASHGLGAQLHEGGATFQLWSSHAERVELCLFDDADGPHESRRVDLSRCGNIWRVHVAQVQAGCRYGYRVHGPWAPAEGARFNARKLLMDPYARRITGNVRFLPCQRGDTPDDSAPAGLRSVVVGDAAFDWRGDRRPAVPWSETVLYEAHVKGMTARHPEVPAALRGSYLGLCQPAVLKHLTALGVTTVSLMPVQAVYHEQRLVELGLVNYWGYAPLGYFAPNPAYASVPGQELDELRTLVRTLHAAGIEVLLDVVYNHTAEADEGGPLLSLRGIDDGAYYRPDPNAPGSYENFSGCGNTLDLRSPPCLALVLDSLRYWAEAVHVDGFRFDLAAALCRDAHGFDPRHPFLLAVAQDPLLRELKMIAEPWDLGGYALGRFDAPWRQWNDRFRDALRGFYAGEPGLRGTLATCLAGSSDLLEGRGNHEPTSVNYVSCHDGFTLRDVVSYDHKHNARNGESNRDGSNHNHSRNWGTEGPTDDPGLAALRARLVRSMLLAVCTGHGVPMIAHGDELGKTQAGNNNAYCLDDPTTWLDHEQHAVRAELEPFLRAALAFRRRHAALRPASFLHGSSVAPGRGPDLSWVGRDGLPLADADWADPEARVLGMLMRTPVPDGVAGHCDAVLCVFNGGGEPSQITLPELELAGSWRLCLDSSQPEPRRRVLRRAQVMIQAHAALALEHEVTT